MTRAPAGSPLAKRRLWGALSTTSVGGPDDLAASAERNRAREPLGLKRRCSTRSSGEARPQRYSRPEVGEARRAGRCRRARPAFEQARPHHGAVRQRDRVATSDHLPLPAHGDRRDGKEFTAMVASPEVRAFAQPTCSQSTEVGLLESSIGACFSPCDTTAGTFDRAWLVSPLIDTVVAWLEERDPA